jgi:hypothetical protein
MRTYRNLLLLTMLLGLASVSVATEDIDVSGNWTLTMTTPRGEQSTALAFVQDGEKLTVTATGDRGESVGKGTITGTTIEWSIARQTPMGEMTMTYKGEVTGDRMTGEVQIMNNMVEWQAVRDSSEPAAAQDPEPEDSEEEETVESSENLLFPEEEIQPVPESLKVGFESITADDLYTSLKFLSSDALQGRETASIGYQIAAEYAATMFSLWDLQPAGDLPPRPSGRRMMMAPTKSNEKPERGYLQQIPLKETVATDGSAKVEWRQAALYKARSFTRDVDYQYSTRDGQTISAPVVFVGYGISEEELEYDDYLGVDAKGKIVIMLSGIPHKDDPDSRFTKEIQDKYDPPAMRRRSRFAQSEKNKIAESKGAVAIIMVEASPEKGDVASRVLQSQKTDDEEPIIPGARRRLSLIDATEKSPFRSLPTVRASRQMADQILQLVGESVESLRQGIEDDFMPHSMELSGVRFTIENEVTSKLVSSPNVLGYVEGSDPELKDEVVVIGAHLDHLGQRGDYIFNGADDNGSGSVAVLELAQAFALNPVKPKRSVLFALWTGEEKGLLGSRHYVLHPYFPLSKTVATLNLDMVSREWDKKRLAGMARMFGMTLSDAQLEAIDVASLAAFSFKDQQGEIRQAAVDNNQYVGMTLLLRESEGASSGGGSDHAPFARKEIPWAFLIAGMTEDYHQPSDTVAKTSKQLMEKIARLSYLTAFTLADSVTD